MPKVNKELLTNHFGPVSDFLSECWSQLRRQSRQNVLAGRVHLGAALIGRDTMGVSYLPIRRGRLDRLRLETTGRGAPPWYTNSGVSSRAVARVEGARPLSEARAHDRNHPANRSSLYAVQAR